jgi:hypothetical protein
MKKEITVDQAITRGHVMVNVPAMLFLFGCPVGAIYAVNQGLIPGWSIGVVFLVGVILACLVWGFMVTRWRIWAFTQVRNVHELKKRAIQEKLIWPEGSVFEKTEIRTQEDTRTLKQLDKKFDRPDEYREDYSLPPKTEIFYSKSGTAIELGVSVLILGVGTYFMVIGEVNYLIFGGIMIAIGVYQGVKATRKVVNRAPQITLDRHGITSAEFGFMRWSSIESEELVREGSGKSAKWFLMFFYATHQLIKMNIDDLDVTPGALENRLRTYRIRFEKEKG